MVRLAYFNSGPPSTEDPDTLIDRLLHPTGPIAVDCETISLKDKTCIGFGIAISPWEAFYVPVLPDRSTLLERAYSLVEARSPLLKVYHNAAFDIDVFRNLIESEKLGELDVWNIQDTSIMAQVSGMRSALDVLGKEVLGYDHLFTIQELLGEPKERGIKRPNMLDVDYELVAEKCCNDVRTTYALYEWFQSRLTPEARDCYDVDIKSLSILKTIELRGLAIDHEALEAHYSRLSQDILIYTDICNTYGFKPGSNQQVGYVLATRGNLLPLTRSKRQLQTSEKVLTRLEDPLAHLVLAYRGAVKDRGTYIIPWRESERAYTQFRLDLSTGRTASYNRNLQNVPPELRDIFDPDDEVWTDADMNQVEMRTFAHLTQDPRMLEAYATGSDLHWATQFALWPNSDRDNKAIRTRSKTFNFAAIFGSTIRTLADNTGLSEEVCKARWDDWMSYYSVGTAWMEEIQSSDVPYAETIYGRRMLVPTETYLLTERNMTIQGARKHIANCRLNWPVQGGAADLVKRGLIYCWDNSLDNALRLPVHDEYLFDGDVEFPSEELSRIYPELHTPWTVVKGPKW